MTRCDEKCLLKISNNVLILMQHEKKKDPTAEDQERKKKKEATNFKQSFILALLNADWTKLKQFQKLKTKKNSRTYLVLVKK